MKPYDYDLLAKYYDLLELDEHKDIYNKLLVKNFKQHHVKTVLDITCGTGMQSIYLNNAGYKVTASDLSSGMIAIARKKAPHMKFSQGDMRTVHYGQFDAVISMFNAIGHLSKKDFEKALRNISSNLKTGGIYIFDIFNLEYMKRNFMTYEYIDIAKVYNDTFFTRFNKNTLNVKKGIMNIKQRTYIQKSLDKPRVIKEEWSDQIYTLSQLKKLLTKTGFSFIEVTDTDGTKFHSTHSVQMRIVAQKK